METMMKTRALRRRYGSAKKAGRIEDTGLLPYAVADGVLEEVERYTGDSIAFKRTLAETLGEKAETVYKLNAQFHRMIKGAAGRDQLWAFMRHWVAAELRRTQPQIGRKLPASFANGAELPSRADYRT